MHQGVWVFDGLPVSEVEAYGRWPICSQACRSVCNPAVADQQPMSAPCPGMQGLDKAVSACSVLDACAVLRVQLEVLEAIVEQERRTRKAREARHKLECDRLRRQIGDLQVLHKPV